VLVARRAERLDELAGRLRRQAGVAVETLVADLARPEDLARVAERVAADDVALLVNSAGINEYGAFAEVDPALLAKVLDLNVMALTVLGRACVPGTLARGQGLSTLRPCWRSPDPCLPVPSLTAPDSRRRTGRYAGPGPSDLPGAHRHRVPPEHGG
jgi:NAD(P)-dependent dehydrogenase (short-subunit alcohol dehydrogenase family)